VVGGDRLACAGAGGGLQTSREFAVVRDQLESVANEVRDIRVARVSGL
jgi:hypothetical protein